MNHLGLILSSLISVEDIIERMEEAITLYKIDPSKENLVKIEVIASLLLSKHTVDADPKGLQGVMETMAKLKRANDLLTPSGN